MGRDSVAYCCSTVTSSRTTSRHRYEQVTEELLELVEARFEQAGTLRYLRIHGDCHRNNVLWTAAGPHFVDLDDCMTGPAIQDLWMLLAGRPAEMREQLAEILEGYSKFAEIRPDRGDADRGAAGAADGALRGLARAPLARSGVPARPFPGSAKRASGSATWPSSRSS